MAQGGPFTFTQPMDIYLYIHTFTLAKALEKLVITHSLAPNSLAPITMYITASLYLKISKQDNKMKHCWPTDTISIRLLTGMSKKDLSLKPLKF